MLIADAEPPVHLPWYRHLYVQVLAAIALGIVVGLVWPETGAALKPLGDLFIKLVKMVIAPVIFLTVVTGIAGMGELRGVGRIAARALGYFFAVSTLALIVGMIVANTVQAGCRPAHRSCDTRWQGGRRLCRQGARHDPRRLHFQYRPQDDGRRAGRRRDPAGAVRRNIDRRRDDPGRRASTPSAAHLRGCAAGRVPARRDPDEGRARRGLRCDRLHHRQIRHRQHRQSRRAGRHFLRDVAAVRPGRARHHRQAGRVQPVAAAGLSQGRVAAGASGHRRPRPRCRR